MSAYGKRILGTAGHIDHGKTALIRALTGHETDRLAEEKQRGISIELGFTHYEIEGSRFGVVDVPGHERFLRHMLAGAQGIDVALLVVAADDGVMPQTEEHFDIVHLLGIERLVFVITKSDLVDEKRITDVREEIAILAAGTSFENAPVCAISSLTGAGVDSLRTTIGSELDSLTPRISQSPFRMPIDRCFILHGHGVVVTGTASSGRVATGDSLTIRPSGKEVRVRMIQVHGEPVDEAGAGQRVALNLGGVEKEEVTRGTWITSPRVYAMTNRFDCEFEVRPGAARPFRSFDRIRLHIGTAEIQGKVIFLADHQEVAPKERVLCQISLDDEILAARGDRFVVRTTTSSRTSGGGMILHPFAPRHRPTDSEVPVLLEKLRNANPADLLAPFLDLGADFASSVPLLSQGLQLAEEDIQAVLPAHRELVPFPNASAPTSLTTKRKWERLTNLITQALANHHRSHPMTSGMDMESLRSRLRISVPEKLFRSVVDLLETEGVIIRDDSLVRLPSHEVQIAADDRSMISRLREALASGDLAPPDAKQLANGLDIPTTRVSALLKVLIDGGEVVRVSGDIHYEAAALERATDLLRSHLDRNPEITVAEYRTAIGASRKYALALMDYFDAKAITIRVGDARRLR